LVIGIWSLLLNNHQGGTKEAAKKAAKKCSMPINMAY
jgi:hypothetical protein